MSIGLYDADIAQYTLLPFNLELMKISAYYKRKGEIVVLSPSFSPEKHKEFFFRKDYEDGNYPLGFSFASNVKFGGHAFSGDQYEALPIEIERMAPDTSIYSIYEKEFLNFKIKKKIERQVIFNSLINGEHCRLSLDGKTLWQEYPKQFRDLSHARSIILHDYNLNQIPGSLEEIKKILTNARQGATATKIGMKFPVIVTTGKDLLDWSSFPASSFFYSLEYRGVIDEESFFDFISRPGAKTISNQIDYYVTASSSDENDFIKNHLREIFRQAILSRSHRTFFTLKYEDNFFSNKKWEQVIELINLYQLSQLGKKVDFISKLYEDTLYDFASHLPEIPNGYYNNKRTLTKQQIRDIFVFVREQFYPLFKDFYECNLKSLEEKGYNDWRIN